MTFANKTTLPTFTEISAAFDAMNAAGGGCTDALKRSVVSKNTGQILAMHILEDAVKLLDMTDQVPKHGLLLTNDIVERAEECE